MEKMLEAVRTFHAKHRFKETGGEDMTYRMNLIMEEVGEICQCLTKGLGKEKLAEEHADLLVLLLGNCISADIDLEVAFWKKMEVLQKRKGKKVGDTIRVTET
jgi:NTP pyrophosphatase (non-canonical NTP hydrolase)